MKVMALFFYVAQQMHLMQTISNVLLAMLVYNLACVGVKRVDLVV
jgi:hypothetical protein